MHQLQQIQKNGHFFSNAKKIDSSCFAIATVPCYLLRFGGNKATPNPWNSVCVHSWLFQEANSHLQSKGMMTDDFDNHMDENQRICDRFSSETKNDTNNRDSVFVESTGEERLV